MSEQRILKSGESRMYSMDFTPNLAPGESIDSIVSVDGSPAGLTIGTASIKTGGKKIEFRISSETPGSYQIVGRVQTDGLNILVCDGSLLVKE